MIRGGHVKNAILGGIAAVLATGLVVSCTPVADDLPPLPGVEGTPFSAGGAWEYNYVSADPEHGYPATRFDDITERLTSGELTARGITNIMIYGPYASTAKWRGLPPTGDFMDFDPENGSIEDWREMAAAASERGITLTTYLALLYLDESSPLFQQAQEDRAAGVDSWQSRLLLWDPRVRSDGEEAPPGPPSERDVVRPSQGGWAFSQIAKEWYATTWDLPALYYGNDSTMEFAHQVLRFWMDNGVQGFEFDAPQTMWGFHEGGEGGIGESRHAELVTYPKRYRPDWQIYTEAEGIGSYEEAEMLDRVGYSHLMLNPDIDDDNFVQRTIRGELSIDELDLHFQTYIDGRREAGKGVYAPMLYAPDASGEALALDIAVQGGSGAVISFDRQLQLDRYRPEVLDRLFEVTMALAASPAEAPSASRTRLASTPADTSYAIIRHSASSAETAVNVYNLSGVPSSITIETGLDDGTRLVDLRNGTEAAIVDEGAITVQMPASGWLFLAVA